MNTSALAEEVTSLAEQIERVRQQEMELDRELRAVENELERFATDRQQIDALRDVCDALERLETLRGKDLFWEGLPTSNDTGAHLRRVRGRVASFDGGIGGILERQRTLQESISKCRSELGMLYEEEREAYEQEERRKDDFVVDRELPVEPYRAMVMPWTKDAEGEHRFRRAMAAALCFAVVLGVAMPLVHIPLPDRMTMVEIPERLVRLVKQEVPTAPPVRMEKAKPVEKETKQPEDKPKPKEAPRNADEPVSVAAANVDAPPVRESVERMGVLKFKNTLSELVNETPLARLGSDARLSDQGAGVRGQAAAQRALVAMQAQGGTSGGIGNAGVSRSVGAGNAGRMGNGGVGITRVESSLADLEEASRPVRGGLIPGRTDEEIQIVFDRYKAALYRIYNTELRKDPTLRGKMLLRISIEPDGALSLCEAESTDLGSPELVAKILARIKRFNFGPKDGVPTTTILYPIEFFPAG